MTWTGRFQAAAPADVRFTLELTMRMGDWQGIAKAVRKSGEPTTYGPTGELLKLIENMVSQAEKTFEPEPPK